MLLCNKEQSRVKMSTEDAELSQQIFEHLSRLSETEAKDVASDPKLNLAVSLEQVSPSALLEKAGSLEKPHLGQVLRINSETSTVAIYRCSHQQRGQWKQRHDQA